MFFGHTTNNAIKQASEHLHYTDLKWAMNQGFIQIYHNAFPFDIGRSHSRKKTDDLNRRQWRQLYSTAWTPGTLSQHTMHMLVDYDYVFPLRAKEGKYDWTRYRAKGYPNRMRIQSHPLQSCPQKSYTAQEKHSVHRSRSHLSKCSQTKQTQVRARIAKTSRVYQQAHLGYWAVTDKERLNTPCPNNALRSPMPTVSFFWTRLWL